MHNEYVSLLPLRSHLSATSTKRRFELQRSQNQHVFVRKSALTAHFGRRVVPGVQTEGQSVRLGDCRRLHYGAVVVESLALAIQIT